MNKLVFIDTETTGLDYTVHDAYEVAWAGETGGVERLVLPHSLTYADAKALEIGRYYERNIDQDPRGWQHDAGELKFLAEELAGATLVGSNPAFDARFLKKVLGSEPWHYRLMNVADGAMWVLDWDRPKGLADIVLELRKRGHLIEEADHTAVNDVLATRDVYNALRYERSMLGSKKPVYADLLNG